MNEYMSSWEASHQWGVSEHRIHMFCQTGQIPGAIRKEGHWLLPIDSRYPTDRDCPLITMTDLYSVPGSADKVADTLDRLNHHGAALFRTQLAYFRGEIETVDFASRALWEQDNKDFNTRIGCGMLLSLVAMCRGDRSLWMDAKSYMESTPCSSIAEKEQLAFWIAATNSAICDMGSFPTWFQYGSLEYLPPDSHPFAHTFYIKLLLMYCYKIVMQQKNLKILIVAPALAEQLIPEVQRDGALMAELYLQLLCAVGWHDLGDEKLAIRHLDCAIELALPDRLYFPLAE